MATRRAIKGVLGNFLGTYASRYTDLGGYWLFGYLIDDLTQLRIDLLAETVDSADTPLAIAVRTAAAKFKDQVFKAGLAPSNIREASLTIQKMPGSIAGSVNGHGCEGHNVNFTAEAATDNGARYRHEHIVFVARHDADVERRSAR